jgi:hypothetical protein
MLPQTPPTDLATSSPLPEDDGRDLSPFDRITVPESRTMFLTTVCTNTVGSVPLAWLPRVNDACREQGGWINIFWAQRPLGASLPRLPVLGIGFIPRSLRLRRASLFGFPLPFWGSRFCRHDASAVLRRAVSALHEMGIDLAGVHCLLVGPQWRSAGVHIGDRGPSGHAHSSIFVTFVASW